MNTSAHLVPFIKGHGTENDFIIVVDPAASLDLAPEIIQALCNRHSGIGADGLLRVAHAGALQEGGYISELAEGINATHWFMDYYNADGSVAEMCGNGLRVFAHVLCVEGLVGTTEFTVGTRAGARRVRVLAADPHRAMVSVDMGSVQVRGLSTCTVAGQAFAGLAVSTGNPHLACVVPGMTAEHLNSLEMAPPVFDRDFFPSGVNVEIIALKPGGDIYMRVYERGVGETRSCGTGTVAAAVAALADRGDTTGTLHVGVLGGEVTVEITEDRAILSGPSQIVARGTIDLKAYTDR
ncbi:diaminopimelate epimerase [Corynebacterium sp. ES2794-CONJ1]|uniref:diaminopimelate epimerase n=1 Tax=Corynebacterium sp. ES2794-CONJ1 TaxID=2980553 RepID=UPI0021D9390A|nr:diaminopimelate epimerase [Corynebacterium sp. ES2794-CONJ1]MCU9518508.1 diaminopimelate epimerase [Corynebacterium sp. ES2794-CONJ1]